MVKKIENTIGAYLAASTYSALIRTVTEKIPGLGPLIEKLMDNIAVFVFTTLEVGFQYHILEHIADSPIGSAVPKAVASKCE